MKKILAIAALAVGGILYAGREKVTSIAASIKHLKIKVTGVGNINFSSRALIFDANVQIYNPTSQDLTLETGGLITLRRLIFKDTNGNILAESYPNITDIGVRAGETITLRNVPTTIPFDKIGVALNAIVPILSNPDNLIVQPELATPAGIFLING